MRRHGVAGVLAAPLMDFSRTTDTANFSPFGSNTMLNTANTPSADAVLAASPPSPPTPRLIAVGPKKPLMSPDLCKLFSLYYDDQTISTEPKVTAAQ